MEFYERYLNFSYERIDTYNFIYKGYFKEAKITFEKIDLKFMDFKELYLVFERTNNDTIISKISIFCFNSDYYDDFNISFFPHSVNTDINYSFYFKFYFFDEDGHKIQLDCFDLMEQEIFPIDYFFIDQLTYLIDYFYSYLINKSPLRMKFLLSSFNETLRKNKLKQINILKTL